MFSLCRIYGCLCSSFARFMVVFCCCLFCVVVRIYGCLFVFMVVSVRACALILRTRISFRPQSYKKFLTFANKFKEKSQFVVFFSKNALLMLALAAHHKCIDQAWAIFLFLGLFEFVG